MPIAECLLRVGCIIAVTAAASASARTSNPLTAFGAAGDGRVDDTQALQTALRSPQAGAGQCLDGMGREYLVRGTLRASTDLCLINTRLRQEPPRFDTRPLIHGDCPVERKADVLIDCGDPRATSQDAGKIDAYLSTRTLLIRPESEASPIKVTLRNVRIDRGDDPSSGARSEAAGIWIQWADRVVLDNVEITGDGKGFGLMIALSSNITAHALNLHDMVWAPYRGDTALDLKRVRALGWNTAPLREYRSAGRDGASASGFFGTRAQEQLTCLMIVGSHNVRLNGLQVRGCRARFAEGDFPWQTDGVGIGQSSSGIRINGGSHIADTWEGIDVVGGGGSGAGVRDIAIADTRIDNSFSYAIKLGYDLANVAVERTQIDGAGLAGIVLYGHVRDAALRQLTIKGVGAAKLGDGAEQLWDQQRAGIVLMPRDSSVPGDYPQSVLLDNVRLRGGDHCRSGVINTTPVRESARSLTVTGCANRWLDRER